MAKHPVFPMWIADYLSDTSHLDATEHGVYHLLLYRYWLTDGRALPEDMSVLRRIARCRTREKVERILTEFWELSVGEGWHHKRAKKELRVTRDRKMAASENAKKRWKNNDRAHAEASNPLCSPSPSPSPEEKEKEKYKKEKEKEADKKVPNCPHQKIIELYHEHTKLRRVREWGENRQSLLRTMWKKYPELEWWEGYFKFVAKSDFLNGRMAPKNGEHVWTADLEWLIKPSNFQKVHEGKYHVVRRSQPRTDIGAHIH